MPPFQGSDVPANVLNPGLLPGLSDAALTGLLKNQSPAGSTIGAVMDVVDKKHSESFSDICLPNRIG
jgi:hypothetical protein